MIHGRRHILEQKISQCDGGHGFYNDNRAGNDNGVMPSVDGDLGIFPFSFTVFLKLCDRGVGFMAARMIRREPSLNPPSVPPERLLSFSILPFCSMEGIIVPASGRSAASKTVADLYAFDGPDREKLPGQAERPACQKQVLRFRQEDRRRYTQ